MPSNVAGYLQPQSLPAPLEDAALEDFIHDVLVGLSGLANEDVRPVWQEEPPTRKPRASNWLAFAITTQPSDTYPSEVHEPDDEGSSELWRHETIEVALNSFGANAGATLRLIRDSIQIEQNRAVLTDSGFGLQETTEIIPAPVLAKAKWLRRYDMKVIFRRKVIRDYEVLNILESDVVLNVQLAKTQVNP